MYNRVTTTGNARESCGKGSHITHQGPRAADGTWFIDFTAVADPGRIVQAAVITLGLREQPSHPLASTLIDYLQPRQSLLIFDNCEHLIDTVAQLAFPSSILLPAHERHVRRRRVRRSQTVQHI